MKRLLLATLTFGLISCASDKKEETAIPLTTATVNSAPSTAEETPTINIPTPISATVETKITNELTPIEWQGKCRKLVNESGTAVPSKANQRLQSAYVFQKDHRSFDVIVKSFADKDCKTLISAHKTVMKCDNTIKGHTANCKNVRWEETKDGTTWKAKPMKDHTGIAVKYETTYSITFKSADQATLTSVGESGDKEVEALQALRP